MTTYQQDRLLQTAWTIDLAITCPGRRCEILLNDISSAECLVEDMCSQVLIDDIFAVVQIDEVSITLGANRQAPMTIILRAQGFEALHTTANLDLLVEEKLSRALAQTPQNQVGIVGGMQRHYRDSQFPETVDQA